MSLAALTPICELVETRLNICDLLITSQVLKALDAPVLMNNYFQPLRPLYITSFKSSLKAMMMSLEIVLYAQPSYQSVVQIYFQLFLDLETFA